MGSRYRWERLLSSVSTRQIRRFGLNYPVNLGNICISSSPYTTCYSVGNSLCPKEKLHFYARNGHFENRGIRVKVLSLEPGNNKQ
jgi:hypothetical protein